MRILSILSLLLMLVFTVAAQEPTITLTDEMNAMGLFNGGMRHITLSPDGRLLAAVTSRDLCIYEIEAEEETCYPFPEGANRISPNDMASPLTWSFDSHFVMFTDDFYTYFYESDLWVFDVESGTFTNLTDDGVEGGILNADTSQMLIDYLPTFAPNGDIYFFRSIRGEDGYTLSLYRFPAGGAEPELVLDLTDRLPTLSIYYVPRISPNGEKLVFPVMAQQVDDPRNGVWLVDLTDQSLTQIATLSDTALGMPVTDDEGGFAYISPVWANDSAGVVVMVLNMRYQPAMPTQNYLYIDVASGEITPIVDMSDVEWTDEALASDNSPRRFVAYSGAVAADGTYFVYINGIISQDVPAQLVWVPLPPDGSEPRVIETIPLTSRTATNNPIMAGDYALLDGMLYTFDIGE